MFKKLPSKKAITDIILMIYSTCLQILEFSVTLTKSSTALFSTSENIVNVYSVRVIQVNLNLITYNITKFQ